MNKRKHSNSIGRLSAAAARRPWPVIVIWVAAILLAASLAGPKLWQVTTNDTSHFLPNKYESVRATQFGQAHFGQLKNASAVTGLVRRDDGQRPAEVAGRRHVDGDLRLDQLPATAGTGKVIGSRPEGFTLPVKIRAMACPPRMPG